MEKRLWLWILEQRRTEAGKGGREKRPDERLEDDGLGKKQGNGGEEEAGDGASGGYDEAADQDVGGTQTVDPAGGEAMGGELGKEAVEDREVAAVLAVEGEEGREGVGGDWRQHWLLPKVLNRERKRRRGEEAKREEKIGLLAQDLLCGQCQARPNPKCAAGQAAIFFLTGRARHGHIFSPARQA